mmetsp:Transcript_19302/g.44892  ORF Transcript_19302/g.44892 Transcript_19302/m.44892 type:complete len:339 (-) Transcript_19302:1184-2200(-)
MPSTPKGLCATRSSCKPGCPSKTSSMIRAPRKSTRFREMSKWVRVSHWPTYSKKYMDGDVALAVVAAEQFVAIKVLRVVFSASRLPMCSNTSAERQFQPKSKRCNALLSRIRSTHCMDVTLSPKPVSAKRTSLKNGCAWIALHRGKWLRMLMCMPLRSKLRSAGNPASLSRINRTTFASVPLPTPRHLFRLNCFNCDVFDSKRASVNASKALSVNSVQPCRLITCISSSFRGSMAAMACKSLSTKFCPSEFKHLEWPVTKGNSEGTIPVSRHFVKYSFTEESTFDGTSRLVSSHGSSAKARVISTGSTSLVVGLQRWPLVPSREGDGLCKLGRELVWC